MSASINPQQLVPGEELLQTNGQGESSSGNFQEVSPEPTPPTANENGSTSPACHTGAGHESSAVGESCCEASSPQVTDAPSAENQTGPSTPSVELSQEHTQKIKEKLLSRARPVGTDEGSPAPELADTPTAQVAPPPDDSQALPADIEAQIHQALSAKTSPEPPQKAGVPLSEEDLRPGQSVVAKVVAIGEDYVTCDIGCRCSALLPLNQFPKGRKPHLNEEFLVEVDRYDSDEGVIHISLPRAVRRSKSSWEDLQIGQVVECYVVRMMKGGLEVSVNNLRAFMPASQVDLRPVTDEQLKAMEGQRYTVEIIDVKPEKRSLIVSRRQLLEKERQLAADNFWKQVSPGQDYEGTVRTIIKTGAFIDLGAVDGFLPISELAWSRVANVESVLSKDQRVRVRVISVDRDHKKLGLSLRQLLPNPWDAVPEKYRLGTDVTGTVNHISEFAAFVTLEPGLEGMIHISELDHRRVNNVSDVVKVGDTVTARVIEVDVDHRRIKLSLKALRGAPPDESKSRDDKPSAERRPRPQRDLKGGTGSSPARGLFGDPKRFSS
ncbi:MAG: hypothetical protein KatS3mg114_0657 [Planctomycetaceae bacterium]|nr:MAG: hypothetical protein KatS3mg114_0657 [Planctomycetaceae bacterium]